MATKKQIRVTLSGSGFRFPAHIGALCAIEEAGYEVIEMSGTSGGSIVASMYAAGHKAVALKQLTLETDFSRFIEFNFSALTSFSWCNGKRLTDFLTSIIGEKTTFSQLQIPIHIVASDIRISSIHVFDKPDENVVQAVRASVAVPFIYSPVKFEDKWLIDGGVCSNTPVELLQDDTVLKLGIKLTSEMDTTPIDSALDILGRTANLLFESNDRAHIDSERMQGALFAFVNTGTAGSFDTKSSVDERLTMFNEGYNQTKIVLEAYEAVTKNKRGFVNYGDINRSLYR